MICDYVTILQCKFHLMCAGRDMCCCCVSNCIHWYNKCMAGLIFGKFGELIQSLYK